MGDACLRWSKFRKLTRGVRSRARLHHGARQLHTTCTCASSFPNARPPSVTSPGPRGSSRLAPLGRASSRGLSRALFFRIFHSGCGRAGVRGCAPTPWYTAPAFGSLEVHEAVMRARPALTFHFGVRRAGARVLGYFELGARVALLGPPSAATWPDDG